MDRTWRGSVHQTKVIVCVRLKCLAPCDSTPEICCVGVILEPVALSAKAVVSWRFPKYGASPVALTHSESP